jgi:hypothetical protein
VLFRPEESHGASGIAHVFAPASERNGYVPDKALRFRLQDDAVLDVNPDRLTAVRTRGVNPNRFPREKPADRQRLERSLRKPFLLSFDRDSELGGKVVEWRERGDEIGIWKQKPVDSRRKEVMKRLPSLLHGDPQFFRYFRIMGRLPRLYHTLHNDMEGLVQFAGLTHDACLLSQFWGNH